MHLRNTCILFYFIAQFSIPAKAQWTPAPTPDGGEVYFLEYHANAYWAGANSGLYRSDNGQTWTHIDHLGFDAYVAALVDADTMYLIQNDQNTGILTTIDGGQSWKKNIVIPEKSAFNPRLYKSGGVLVVSNVGQFMYYFRSIDNGASFQGFQAGQQDMNGGLFDANGGVMAYFFSYFYVSIDGGNTFSPRPLPGNHNEVLQVLATDSALVIRSRLNSGAPEVFISFDAAQTWQTVVFPAGFTPSNSTIGRQGKRALFLQKPGEYAMSNDHGNSWQIFTTPLPPRKILQTADGWHISTANGIYRSVDAGVGWSTASEGFKGHIITHLFNTPNHLYLRTSQKNYYAAAFGSSAGWQPIVTAQPTSFAPLAFKGEDTLVLHNQLSFDRGLNWTDITYPNVNAFGIQHIVIHSDHAYVPNRDKLQVVPLEPAPKAQTQSFPGGNDAVDVLFAGDTLYLVSNKSQVFRQLPGAGTWQTLNQAGNTALPAIFRVNGRFFVTRGNDLLYSDNGEHWQPFPTDRFPWTIAPITYFENLTSVDSVLVAASLQAGLLFSANGGEDWWRFQTGIPGPLQKASGLAVGPDYLYAAMYQGGLWQRKLQLGSATGIVFHDNNNNGIQEPGEPPLANVSVYASGSGNVAVTDSAGEYQLWFDGFSDSLQVVLPAPNGSTLPVKRFVQGIQVQQNFGVWLQPGVIDVGVKVVNTSALRPGYNNGLAVHLVNNGNDVAAVTVTLTLPPGIEFLSATPAPTTMLGDSIVWIINALSAFERLDLSVVCRTGNSLIPGDVLFFKANAIPGLPDIAPTDNVFLLSAQVVGSYDPNDKQVQPPGPITTDQLAAGQPLQYTIRFQNTGNHRADRVRLIDTLDNRLNLSSLQLIGASHPFTWRVLDGYILEVLFDNIALPDSNSDEAGSHGFFSFSVQGKPSLAPGVQLINQALIFFDFNAPVMTNTVATEIKLASDIPNMKKQKPALRLTPNPASSLFYAELPASGGSITLFRMNGTPVQRILDCPPRMMVDIRELPAGPYIFYWELNGTQVSSVLVIAR